MFNRNNLDLASSIYLRQHSDNPIFWQEFSQDVVSFAKENNKPILISIGYSSCHWCHVMAADTFSDQAIADFLNENFVCVKVDREQRPDIDSFCMSFIQEAYGQGGWPLNVVTTPDLKPFFAATYIPAQSKHSMPGFLDVAQQVLNFYKEQKGVFDDYTPRDFEVAPIESLDLSQYINQFDKENAGFISKQKFPPHCTLMFLLSTPHSKQYDDLCKYLKLTLDTMSNSGLCDHLGGGFFRYCVDSKWEIPHFEKMLYDQAMMLINYSLGYFEFKEEKYLITITQILKCLETTFKNEKLYISGIDADTNHVEGLTYLWDKEEIEELGIENFVEYEGKYHLVKEIDEQHSNALLQKRNQRDQPVKDTKIITSWNCLLGIGLAFVEKFTPLETNFEELFIAIGKQKNSHSSNAGKLQNEYFLEDAASYFLLQSFAFEKGSASREDLDDQYNELMKFKKGDEWIDNPNSDFREVHPDQFDHPFPSTQTILEWALLRYSIINETEFIDLDYKMPLNFDAYNYIVAFQREHKFYKSNMEIEAQLLSLIIQDASNIMCYKGTCTPIS